MKFFNSDFFIENNIYIYILNLIVNKITLTYFFLKEIPFNE